MSEKYPYHPELAQKVLDEISTTKLGVTKICKKDGMPCETAFYTWLGKDLDNLGERYALARDAQSEIMAQEMMERATAEGVTAGEINRDRLAIDTMKWIASKLKPKKYGDNQQVNHTGTVQVEQLVIQRTPRTIEHQPEIKTLPVITIDNTDNVNK